MEFEVTQWYCNTYEGLFVYKNEWEAIEGEIVFRWEGNDDNIWKTFETLEILINEDGIGYRYEVPAGYSSVTYDPEVTTHFHYTTSNFDEFMRYVLTQDLREKFNESDIQNVRRRIMELRNSRP